MCNEDYIPSKDRICLVGLCATQADCPSSLRCVVTAGDIGSCNPPGVQGAPSTVDDDCVEGHRAPRRLRVDSVCEEGICSNAFADFCAAPERVVVGTTSQQLSASTDVFTPRCGGFSAVDRVYDYVVRNPRARVIITPDAATTISVFAGDCVETTVEACAAGVGGGSGVSRERAAGDVVTFVASSQTNVVFTIAEQVP